MKETARKALVLLAAVWLSFGSVAAATLEEREVGYKYSAWNYLCLELQTEYTCRGVRPPTIIYKRMTGGLRGYYEGGYTIYVRRGLSKHETEATLIHEMAHYLEWAVGRIRVPGPAYGICLSEKFAWDTTDNYYRAIGQARRAANGEWTEWYKHCTPYKDVLYPEGTNAAKDNS